MKYGVFIGNKNTSPQTLTVLRIFLGYQILWNITFFKFSCRNHYDKVLLLLYVLYPSKFYVLVDRLPEVGGVPPKHVAVNKRLYFCVI